LKGKNKIKRILTNLFYWKQINPRKLIDEFFPAGDKNETEMSKTIKDLFIYTLEEDFDSLLSFLQDKIVTNIFPKNKDEIQAILLMCRSLTFSGGD
jgi:hypothetical protein